MTQKIEQLVPIAAKFDINTYPFFHQKPEYVAGIFDAEVIDFFQSLSRDIIKHQDLGKIPEMIALAFWLRKSNLSKIASEHAHLKDSTLYKTYPLGTVFHICPANVDTMFIYSLGISLLMGNRNILRVSQKMENSYVSIVFDAINQLIHESFPKLLPYISIVRYERDDASNAFFSTHADARIIWGGNQTVETFRKTDTNPRSKDLVFADRHSAAVIHSGAWQKATESAKQELAQLLYNDSYSFDQKGCSCPGILFFLGTTEESENTSVELYALLSSIATKQYDTDPYSLASLKLIQADKDAISGIVSEIKMETTTLFFNTLTEATVEMESGCGGGYFYTKHISQLKDIQPFVNKGMQTLGHWGLNETDLDTLANATASRGVDRIVPIGKALEFGYIWDGYNLVEELCSKKQIRFK